MKKRIIKKSGYIFKFPTINKEHGYCQWLPHTVKYFLISTERNLKIDEIIKLKETFSVVTYKEAPYKYNWEKIGEQGFDEKHNETEYCWMQSPFDKEKITLLKGSKEKKSTYEEAINFEPCSVWNQNNIVERLLAQINEIKKII